MFKFDFQVEEIEKESAFAVNKTACEKESSSYDCTEWYDSEEILPSKEIIESLDICQLNATRKIVNGRNITHMVPGFLLEDLRENGHTDLDIKKAENQHSDLIPGVYEGGAKIWECTEDLLMYLSENYAHDEWNAKKVLDLGCGSGIVGIYCLLNGAKVTFQDYNKDVLEKITIPNVLLNTASLDGNKEEDVVYDIKKFEENTRFYSGDWEKWTQLTKSLEKFDLILTCETIYNPHNKQKLINCLYEKLKPDGTVLVAAKTYYFGVGGGLRQFEKLVEEDQRFEYKTVWESNDGVKREILELKRLVNKKQI